MMKKLHISITILFILIAWLTYELFELNTDMRENDGEQRRMMAEIYCQEIKKDMSNTCYHSFQGLWSKLEGEIINFK